ncbi:hypothetical protein BZA05DRAFT_383204 [Tricharina praecox]|uniref:uncharacterized protein n=1 Tax=Tricharina praecox TaxID=43433 RepID=UPI0022207DB4|nr:uncharacterized protein BZA05DRAFT_383204 [Tricharina praecox]KAI5859048.1 hypothetical protein BZA05DRAFT_383204 [Tricharina praecox]
MYQGVHRSSSDFTQPQGLVASDLQLKGWIRILKFFARVLSLICSAVVIGLSIATFKIFLATKDLPARNTFLPWARPTVLWPQILTLTIACISFLACIYVIWGYIRNGHRGGEAASPLATTATVIGFIAWIVIWAAAGTSMQTVRASQEGKDMWGWACNKDAGPRRQAFANKIDYDLVCTMQDWNFICTMIHVATVVLSAAVWVAAVWRLRVQSRIHKGCEKGGSQGQA